MRDAIVEMAEWHANERGSEYVPRDFFVEAVERIESGEFKVRFHSCGEIPSLVDVYQVAYCLYRGKLYKEKPL